MKKLVLFLAAVLFFGTSTAAHADGSRIFDNAIRPYRLLAKQYATGANVFPTADPTPAGTPLTLANALGRSSNNGVVTLGFQAGFTAPITLTVYYWQYDAFTPANACWVRAASTSSTYSASVDSNYASIAFSVPPDTPFLVQSSAAVTGKVYCSALADPANPGSSVAGY